jgi:hypothetical protein
MEVGLGPNWGCNATGKKKGIEVKGNIMELKAYIECWNADIKVCYMKVGMEIVTTWVTYEWSFIDVEK